MRSPRPLLLAVLAAISCLLGVVASTRGDGARGRVARNDPSHICNRFASPRGSDSRGHGTFRRPFRTLGRLAVSLHPGQTGCLRGGIYGSIHARYVIKVSGTPAARITIRSYPRERAKVVGWIELEGSYVTLSHLRIDGSNTFYDRRRPRTSCHYPVSEGLVIAGRDDVFEFNDYYQSVASLRGNGIGIGWWGNVENTVIRFNKLHDVGGCDFYDHLIYLAHGNNVQVYGNWMWNDPHGWGVKLDPGPTGARVWGNVIAAAGSGFNFGNSSGSSPTANNQVFDNVVMHSVGVSNPDIGWSHRGVMVTSPGLLPASTGNLVYGNDSYDNPGGIANLGTLIPGQIVLMGNLTAKPHFANATSHNYRLLSRIRRQR
jgi:hypothetical protein